MSKFEQLLVPGSMERPDCRCGQKMQLFDLRFHESRRDVESRSYHCEACGHQFKLTVWAEAS
jgi:hypothetical protein